jgi:hypothetical protein
VEKSSKPSSIKNNSIIFLENHNIIKKILSNYNIESIEIENILNKNEYFKDFILKTNKIPTFLLEQMSFEQLYQNNKFKFIIPKNIYEYISTLSAIEGILYLKLNYINQNHYILKNNSFFLLEKLRNTFLEKGGKIEFFIYIKNIEISENIQFLLYTNNLLFISNFLISTVKNTHLISPFDNLSFPKISLINYENPSLYREIPNKNFKITQNYILNKFNISFPDYNNINTSSSIFNCIQNTFQNKFFICSDKYSLNPKWINGSLQYIDKILKLF